MKPSRRGGFTLLEVLVAVGVACFFALLFIPVFHPPRRGCCGGRGLKDSTQVRGLHQAFVVWAQNNKDRYPLPSAIDVNNATVMDEGAAKDHTAHILSMLVFNGTISTDLLISPAEASGSIRLKDDYEFDQPKAAVDPARALWDPSLLADFTAREPGNVSYAHVLPSGARLDLWTFDPAVGPNPRVVLGNRGPEVAAATPGRGTSVTPQFVQRDSITNLIHGSRKKWEGHIAFADNHVELLTTLSARTFATRHGFQRDDILFLDEREDPAASNDFLGIFTKAGGTPSEFKSVWD